MHIASAVLVEIIKKIQNTKYKILVYKTNNNPSGLHYLKQSLDRGKLKNYHNMNYAFLKGLYIFKIPICLKHILQLYWITHKTPLYRYKTPLLRHFLCEAALAEKKTPTHLYILNWRYK